MYDNDMAGDWEATLETMRTLKFNVVRHPIMDCERVRGSVGGRKPEFPEVRIMQGPMQTIDIMSKVIMDIRSAVEMPPVTLASALLSDCLRGISVRGTSGLY
jgi:hypothetical protein